MRKRLLIALPIFLFLAAGVSAAADRHDSTLANPGFEDGDVATAAPSGWRSAGDRGADFTEAGGHSGGFHLTHWSAEAYKVETTQKLTGTCKTAGTRSAPGCEAAREGTTARSGSRNAAPDDARVQVPVSTCRGSRSSSRRGRAQLLHDRAPLGRSRRRMGALRRRLARPRRGRLSVLGGDVSSLTKSE